VAVAVAKAAVAVVVVPIVGDVDELPGFIIEGRGFKIIECVEVAVGGDGAPVVVEEDVGARELGPGDEGRQEKEE